jgi:hypothetical protein
MHSMWKSIKNVVLPGLVLGTCLQMVAPTIIVSKAAAQTPSGQSSSIKQVDRRYNISFEYKGCQRAKSKTSVACEVIATILTIIISKLVLALVTNNTRPVRLTI